MDVIMSRLLNEVIVHQEVYK